MSGGTADTGGFGNTEYFVDLKPKAQWRPVFHEDKERLIAAMNRELEKLPGATWNFSQPIEDNVGETQSGTKGQLAVKLLGSDLQTLDQKGAELVAAMTPVPGVKDLKLFPLIGQPNLNFTIDRAQAARFGINVADIQDAIETAVGGKAVSQVLQGESIPEEMREAARLYRFSSWQRFTQMELPYAALGLIWNSMMSVAGGWFFLMACEMFVLGSRDFRLPGLGSYLQTASSAGDTRTILWGLFAMIAVIVLLDQLVWRPVIAWAQKFKFEQVESSEAPRSPILTLLRKSHLLHVVNLQITRPLGERAGLYFAKRSEKPTRSDGASDAHTWVLRAVGVIVCIGIVIAVFDAARLLSGLTRGDLRALGLGAGATFLRVLCALVIAIAWTVPVGVKIGFSPRLARIAQPVAQIAASVPATALFPVVLLVLIRLGGGLGIGSIVLLLLGTQWYVLFNVIAGAMAIPTDLKEAADVFRFGQREKWRRLILPGIFPYLVTGLVTAAGGAWNASIVAEYFHLRGKTISTMGLGATISHATDSGNFRLLLAATILMAAIVVTVNRTIWRPMYRLAEKRFRLEA